MEMEAKHEDIKMSNENMAEVSNYEFMATLI